MKVYITRKLPINIGEQFREHGIDYEISESMPSKLELLSGVRDADGIISLLTDPIDREVINSAPNLKVIANYAVGYDNIDIEYAASKGIYVTNTPDVLTETTADLAFGLILSAGRRITEGDKYLRAGNFRGWTPDEMLGTDIFGKTIGIVGFGRIGQAVGRRAAGFNMTVLYTAHSDRQTQYASQRVSFEELIEKSDVISINAPLNSETQGLFNYDVFKKMKKNAVLVNTARGKIIKEGDLVKALKEGIIRFAGLDVYEEEPRINQELLKMDNVVLTPHIGSATVQTRQKMAVMCTDAVIDVLIRGRRPDLCVNM